MTQRSSAPGSSRATALDILRRVERGGAFASLLLQRMDAAMPVREAALATELVYGCLRHRALDEHLLAALAGRPLAEIDADIALLFRMGAHQILRLDRIPERAAVHETVEAARTLPGRGKEALRLHEGGARFLNALLRRLCREKGRLPIPPLPSEADALRDPDRADALLSLHFSHASWLIRRWRERFGFASCLALLAANNRPAPPAVRVDLARAGVEEARAALAAEGVATSPSEFLPEFLRVLEGAPQRTECFRKGWIYIQDEASGIVPHLLRPAPGERVLDACSAPGGKTMALARMVARGGLVVAADLHPSRLKLVASNVRRMRLGNVRCVACDVRERDADGGVRLLPPLHAIFDAILVDAPCSGSGVFRRDVDSRYRMTPGSLADLAANQLALLRGAAALLKPRGRLVYSVCSLEPEEGPDVVRAFLDRHSDFRAEDARPAVPAHPEIFGADGCLQTLPHRDDLDGFYAAVMRRQ